MPRTTSDTKTKQQNTSRKKKPDLAALAEQIIASHQKARSAEWKSLPDACETGALLNKAKDQLKHGEWGLWVTKNCRFSLREAQRYTFIADHADELQALRADAKRLSVRAALAKLSKKRETGPAEVLTFTEAELEEANKVPAKPELTAGALAAVKALADQTAKRMRRLAGRTTLKGPEGEAAPALVFVALREYFLNAFSTPDRVPRLVAPATAAQEEQVESPNDLAQAQDSSLKTGATSPSLSA